MSKRDFFDIARAFHPVFSHINEISVKKTRLHKAFRECYTILMKTCSVSGLVINCNQNNRRFWFC